MVAPGQSGSPRRRNRASKPPPSPRTHVAPVHNADVAAMFDEFADLLELDEANPFRVRAYRNAARQVRDLTHELGAMITAGEDLTALPGIGKDLAAKIREIVHTGESAALSALRESIPPALVTLTRLPGLGPRRVRSLHLQLGVATLDDLAAAARAGEIRALPGFGERTEQQILRAIEAQKAHGARSRLADVEAIVADLLEYLRNVPGVHRAAIAGSVRRCKETVGDLDVLVTAEPTSPVMDHAVAYGAVASVVAKGATRVTVVLRSGLQVDVRAVPSESSGAALHYFTGSKAHSIAVRRLGQAAGLKINEYGVFRGEARVAGDTEESVYASVGLPWIPPELREDRGEIAAAQARTLPQLVTLRDLRGDLHSHTTATDGRDTLRAMAAAARAQGRTYLAITEHSQRLTVAHGLDAERLARHTDAIDQLNSELEGITLLKGIEVDILADGTLDLPDDVLARLDLVVAAVHSRFGLGRDAQTARLLRAMDNAHFTILAHPTGRLLLSREPYDVDMERVIRRARQRGCFLELNSQPARLDVSDVYAQLAKSEGVLVAISSDAHSVGDLENLRFGVGQARRGWLEPRDVLNTRPLADLRTLLRRTMA